MVLGGTLVIGLIQFKQFQYCIGGWVTIPFAGTYCAGALVNYTWVVGLAVALVGLLVLVFGARGR
jgi:hypothetical protein